MEMVVYKQGKLLGGGIAENIKSEVETFFTRYEVSKCNGEYTIKVPKEEIELRQFFHQETRKILESIVKQNEEFGKRLAFIYRY